MATEHGGPEQDIADLATLICPAPEPAVVPCVWDNEAEKFVPVYSHRGVEIQGEIKRLQARVDQLLEAIPQVARLAMETKA